MSFDSGIRIIGIKYLNRHYTTKLDETCLRIAGSYYDGRNWTPCCILQEKNKLNKIQQKKERLEI